MALTACTRSIIAPATGRFFDSESLAPRVAFLRVAAPAVPALSSKALPLSRAVLRTLALAQDAETVEGGAGGDSPAGTKLYVGNLPWNVDSATLAEIFQDAGVVEEVEVMCDRDTGRSRGFAFVVMSSPEDAQAAIDRFDGSDLGGRSLRVNYPAPPGQRREREVRSPRQAAPRGGARTMGTREENPNKLYVGNLSWGVDDLALQDLFSEFGKVLEARVVMDRDTGRSRGFGFVTLSSSDEVGQAVNNLDGADFDGRQLRVNPASQKPKA